MYWIKIAYIDISSLCFHWLHSPSQEYCFLHCTCSRLPAPHLPAEDEVCSGGSPFLSPISCPLSDKFSQFRSLLFYRSCSIGPRGEEAIRRNGIPNLVVRLFCKTLVNLSTSLFAVYLDSRKAINNCLIDWTDYGRKRLLHWMVRFLAFLFLCYHTSKAARLMLKGLRPRTIICFALIHDARIVELICFNWSAA